MPYKKIKLRNPSNAEKKAFLFLMQSLKIPINEAQKLIDKKRLFCNGNLVEKKNEILQGVVELIIYENAPKGVKIVYENEEFAVLEKPSGILSHPNGRNCAYSLCDEIWELWGREACVAHRLDKETSGLILVAKTKKSQVEFKAMFEKRAIQKEYLALTQGLTKKEFEVDLAMALTQNYDDVKTRMQISPQGKRALSFFERVEFYPDFNASLVLCKPFTGRQHQLRLHLFHSGYKILGEPLYGLKKEQVEQILDGKLSQEERVKLTGAKRLMLHSQRLHFYYKGKEFDIGSKEELWKEFCGDKI
ncbi:RluA family pseudouridine synthase [Campylobacter vulpis]|uniref:RNA pseudouridylate synthase n=1 Tax=Campylobacter vulpis TaxID=1655500 RepID=A0A2G4R323_9BACT|nr:RluA family pseudouridine synthase [Campylobacter vulpis]MBS4241327.1 RluA family pseudouridine synthase [Campylobacter vulpis]MBS4253239.1 RluA family pseudouridine synthase [Campylobacter vulpis]MBS4282142.1 RluA family pseudouridine synthase [Campylobacter vulpis]MBS4314369.1 RluA family pseudouridine synthase [Campylobacter vulpis]MBS4331198.1 RluA family pseudouridine synthase [Campylobacter vulpis]